MATITEAKLTIKHDHSKKTAHAVVKCKVSFSPLEHCLMKSCGGRMFKLKCALWGADSGFNFGDDHLYTYSDVYYFPDGSPTATESRTFDVVVGEGLLDEDWGRDEVYGRVTLYNFLAETQVNRKTNEVHHSF